MSHVGGDDPLVEILLAHAADRQSGLPQADALMVGVLSDLRSQVVTDVTVESRDLHEVLVEVLLDFVGVWLDAVGAMFVEADARIGDKADRLQAGMGHDGLEHVELEVALRTGKADCRVVTEHAGAAVTKDGIPYRPSLDGLPPRSIAPSKAARTITLVILAVVACYFLLPIIWLVIASTKNNTDLVSTSGFAFGEFNWAANWHALMAWTKGVLPRWVLNSLLYSTVSGVVGTLISVSCGYAISKFRFPGRRVLLVVIMIGLLMPVALLTVPLYLLFIKMHLVNTMWAMIIPSMVSPFGVFLGNVYADSSVPTELLEAARIDGAGELRIFSTMVLRLLAPAMVTIFLFIFVATWNNFLLPLMMITDENLQPVTQGLYGMMAYFAPDKGAVMLASVIGVVPLVILFLVLQRYWQSGLAAGAVKG